MFVAQRRFVYSGGKQFVRLDAGLLQQLNTARRPGRKDELLQSHS